MRGHAELMYADWILMAAGAYMLFNGMENALLVLGAGVVLHFASGGTMPF